MFASRLSQILRGDMREYTWVHSGVPLAARNPKRRGDALASLVRAALADRFAHLHFRSAERSLRMDGRLRGHAQYDWLCDGRRIERKSSQLCWRGKGKARLLRYKKAKLASGSFR